MSVLDNVEGVDAGLHDNNPDTNYECGQLILGAYVNLWGYQAKDDWNSVAIRIDISALPGDAEISEGLLYIYVSSSYAGSWVPSDLTWYVCRCLMPWVSDECTYNSYSTGNAWAEGAAIGEETDHTRTDKSITVGTDVSPTWWPQDVTDLVIDAHADRGDSFDVILIPPPGITLLEGDHVYYKVRGCNEEGYEPYLKITYTSAGGDEFVAKISGVTWANVKKVSGVAEASISKVSGVSAN